MGNRAFKISRKQRRKPTTQGLILLRFCHSWQLIGLAILNTFDAIFTVTL